MRRVEEIDLDDCACALLTQFVIRMNERRLVTEGDASRPRSPTERAVMEQFLAGLTVTRSQLANATGLSKPTVHGVVASLEAELVVEQVGKTAGSVGRSAALYRVNPLARAAIGVDLGGTKILAAISDVSGAIRAERRIPTGVNPTGKDLVARLGDLCRALADQADLPWSTVGAIAVGSPGVTDPVTGHIDLAANIPALADTDLRHELSAELGKPILLENDVNLAVIGERWKGLAQRSDDVVFINLGTGLGMGILARGEVWRGSSGSAGEIGFLPLGADLFDPSVHELGPLEEVLSARGVAAIYERRRAETSEGPLPSPREIFRAALSNTAARQTVEEIGRYLTLAIAAVQAVLDPERVIIGGGIGANPLLLKEVRDRLERLPRRPISVDISALGERAALVGALFEALKMVKAQLVSGPILPANGEPEVV
jgi:glucokinase